MSQRRSTAPNLFGRWGIGIVRGKLGLGGVVLLVAELGDAVEHLFGAIANLAFVRDGEIEDGKERLARPRLRQWPCCCIRPKRLGRVELVVGL